MDVIKVVNTDNFENIALTEAELAYLKSINSKRYSEVDENREAFSSLSSLGFAEKVAVNFDDGKGNRERKYQAIITEPGRRYLLYHESKSKEKAKSSRRYWITTAIAIAALILSLAALLWQAYTWTYEIHHESDVSSYPSSILWDGTPSVEGQPVQQEGLL